MEWDNFFILITELNHNFILYSMTPYEPFLPL